MNLRGNSGEEHPPPAQRSYRLWAAFAVLPFVDALAGFVGFPLVWYTGGHTGQLYDAAQAARAFGLAAGLAGLVVTLGGAVPAVFWLMKRGPVTLWQLIAAGLILGNVPFVSYVFRLVWSLSLMALNGEPISRHLAPIPDSDRRNTPRARDRVHLWNPVRRRVLVRRDSRRRATHVGGGVERVRLERFQNAVVSGFSRTGTGPPEGGHYRSPPTEDTLARGARRQRPRRRARRGRRTHCLCARRGTIRDRTAAARPSDPGAARRS